MSCIFSAEKMNTESLFSNVANQRDLHELNEDLNNRDTWTQVLYRPEWEDILESDEIFWSDDENVFVSSDNILTITVASDSDSNDNKISVFESIEDQQCWADNEIELELCKDQKIGEKLCWTCKINMSQMQQCLQCWTNNKTKACRPRNKKPKRKKLMYKDTSVQDMSSAEDTNICLICCNLEKDAAFVHSNSAHFLCCYKCCKTIFEEKGRCPYCNRIIEKIVKIRC